MSIMDPQVGTDQSPAPKMTDRLAYYESLNQEPEGAGTPEVTDSETQNTGNKVDPTPAVSGTETQAPQVDPRKEGLAPQEIRRISVLTARAKAAEEESRSLKSRLADLEAKVNQKPELTRDHFRDETAYEAHREQQLLEKAQSAFDKRHTEEALARQEQQAFKASWATRSQSLMAPQELQEFAELVQATPDILHEDVHDYIKESEVGPVMLKALLLEPDFAHKLSAMKPINRASMLLKLEAGIIASYQSRQQPAAPAAPQVTRAPTPVGTVPGGSGATTSGDEDTHAQVAAYKRSRFGGR